MIGKIMIGKSFRGCISYCLEDKKLLQPELSMQKRAEVLYYNQCFGNIKELIEQFTDVRNLNQKQSKPVLHITLSMSPGEKLEKEILIDVVEQCAKTMGFERNQYLAIQHLDTAHQHLHIVVNRIGFDGRSVSDSNSYKKIAGFCRTMEHKYDLQQVLNPRRFLSKEQRQLPRLDSRKQVLKKAIESSLSRSANYAAFADQMKSLGYAVEKGRGIAFIDEKKVRVKGSEVGYALGVIEKKLAEQKQNFSTAIPRDNFMKLSQKLSVKNNFSLTTDLQIKNTEILNVILKPETQTFSSPTLLKKKRKKSALHNIYKRSENQLCIADITARIY